ncbi:MAG: FAD/NAD(P)-binding oxidoreductase [Anaerolineae bacterium]|nr:FAD/NAD(P)-binding oxidoreductase [Anaerolineae bacterium]MDK1081437.1 FAD/NAD(P)-binding oxidoreductase [Anaerolineae bacterium]
MNSVLILGGGFGGLAAALSLRDKLGTEVEITLVDRRPYFMVGFHKTWTLIGKTSLESGQRPLAALEKHNVNVILGNIESIDPKERSAVVSGKRYQADALIIALGAQLAPEMIPGFQDHALNVYDPEDIPRAAQSLQEFSGGRIMVGIFGEAYKCPPAPFEIAILVHEMFQARKIDVQIEVFTPKPMSLPILGDAGCSVIEGRMDEHGIGFFPNHKATGVQSGKVTFEKGERKFDLLLGIPPHRCPDVVKESGLTAGQPWVPVDPGSLQTEFEGVYAVGDLAKVMMANGKRLPMAGVFAQAQAQAASEHIAAAFQGRKPEHTFSGEGGCYLEIGGGQAMMIEGKFLAEPKPQVSLSEPSTELVQEKEKVERELLDILSP